MNSVVLKVWAFDICLMLTFELRKTLGKAPFSGKDTKTKHNLSKKKYLGDFKNHRRGFYGFILSNYSDKGHLEPG